mmetsp:Transcript_69080/g.179461  ORF Transcript_69080/g.179461 Transcript_69080/m.179461 type:complete len:110 (-) Transcript_69080:200-529(-)
MMSKARLGIRRARMMQTWQSVACIHLHQDPVMGLPFQGQDNPARTFKQCRSIVSVSGRRQAPDQWIYRGLQRQEPYVCNRRSVAGVVRVGRWKAPHHQCRSGSKSPAVL